MDDHSKANDSLNAAAQKAVPFRMSAEHQKILDRIKQMQGERFEKAYPAVMVNDHADDMEDFIRVSKKANDAGLKRFAAYPLKVFEGHYEMINNLHDKAM